MSAARRLAAATLVITATVAVAACGGSSNSGRDAAAAAAVSQSFLNSTSPNYDLTSSQTGCLGTGIIKNFGIDQAIKYKFLAAGNKPVASVAVMLPTADAQKFTDTFISCVDTTSIIKGKLIAAIAPKTPAARQLLQACLDKNLTTAVARADLVQAFSGAQQTALNPVFAACSKVG